MIIFLFWHVKKTYYTISRALSYTEKKKFKRKNGIFYNTKKKFKTSKSTYFVTFYYTPFHKIHLTAEIPINLNFKSKKKNQTIPKTSISNFLFRLMFNSNVSFSVHIRLK